MISSGKGLVKGKAGVVYVEFTDGEKILVLTSLSATAAYVVNGVPGTALSPAPVVALVAGSTTRWSCTFTSSNLSASGKLAVEFTPVISGQTVNPNARPLVIPVRDPYLDAV